MTRHKVRGNGWNVAAAAALVAVTGCVVRVISPGGRASSQQQRAALIAFRPLPDAPSLPGDEALIPCDLDGDGRGDFIRKSRPRPTIYFSRGDGSFDAVSFPFGAPFAM